MANGEDQVLGFRGAIERNRATYFLQNEFAFGAFFGLCERFDRVVCRLQLGRNEDGQSLVSLMPFLLLAQRQAMNAFESFATCRSYDGWMLLRPAIEAALIVGKWIDDPENARIWSARTTRKTEYIKNFSGKGLASTALPRAADLKSVLDQLNDEFVHANEPYYERHTNITEADPGHVLLRVEFFDGLPDAEIHTVAFLHLIAVVTDSLDRMISTALVDTGVHVAGTPMLEATLRERANRLRREYPQAALVLANLGLWAEESAANYEAPAS